MKMLLNMKTILKKRLCINCCYAPILKRKLLLLGTIFVFMATYILYI